MICENDIDALLEQAGLVINAIQDHLRVKSDSGAEEILNKYLVFFDKCSGGSVLDSDVEAVSGLSRMYMETSSDWRVLFLNETGRMEKIIKKIRHQ